MGGIDSTASSSSKIQWIPRYLLSWMGTVVHDDDKDDKDDNESDDDKVGKGWRQQEAAAEASQVTILLNQRLHQTIRLISHLVQLLRFS